MRVCGDDVRGFFLGTFRFPRVIARESDDSAGDPNLKQASPKKDSESRNMRGRGGRRDSI
jgi:hypothetical protein